jgi:hypothetical protein
MIFWLGLKMTTRLDMYELRINQNGLRLTYYKKGELV